MKKVETNEVRGGRASEHVGMVESRGEKKRDGSFYKKNGMQR